MLVIVELVGGPRRFRQLQRAVDGISQRMLTLTHLVKALVDWSLAHCEGIARARHVYDDAHPGADVR